MTAKRFVPALVIAFVLAGAASTQAQTPVTDFFAIVQHILEVGLQQTQKVIRQSQAEKVYKMSVRLAAWVSLAQYVIDRDFMPEWRIHCWFAECGNLYANDYLQALTYGDPSGRGYDSVTLKRADPSGVFHAGLTDKAEVILRSALAAIDLMDSTMIRDSHTAGINRFGGRNESQVLIDLQAAILDEDGEQSLAAVMDKASVNAMTEAANKQTQAQLDTAIVEQLLTQQTVEREGDVALMNMSLTWMAAQEEDAARAAERANAPDPLKTWHLR
jgi:hypothetical protein